MSEEPIDRAAANVREILARVQQSHREHAAAGRTGMMMLASMCEQIAKDCLDAVEKERSAAVIPMSQRLR